MRRRPVWIGALALGVLLVGAAMPVRVAPEAPEAVSDDTVVARIGETTYTLADIRQRLARLEAPYRYAAERRLPEYVREVVRREVLAREARRLGLDRAPALQAELEEAVQTILLRALVKQVMIEAMPGPEEVQAYYQAHEAEFRLPEQVEVDQVRVGSAAEGEAIRAAVAAGQPFEGAVAARTEAPVDVAIFARGQREAEVERVTFALRVGEVSPPVPTREGVYFFHLRAHHPARLQPLAEATPPIQARLSAENRERRWKQLEGRLWAAEGVQIHEDLLKVTVPRPDSPPAAAEPPGAPVPPGAVPPK
jgi:parvulin-like peptidyl-prolyl isomerase